MVFSRASSYGILTVIYLAQLSDERPRPIRTIADGLGIRAAFLAKIVQTLVQQGIICSHKGPGGGIRLARSPKELTLGQVVVAIDGVDYQSICILGMPGCSSRRECLFQACKNKIQSGISELLSDQNVFQVAMTFKGQTGLSPLMYK
jgi:Rrf2 family nitric oxide-sensitive transcriptional repressor